MSSTAIPQNDAFFDLTPGKYLDVQINHPVKVRLKAQLIGYDLGNYIVLKYPDVKRGGNYRDVLVEGNVVIARYLVEGKQGQCFAFRTTIRNITKYPEPFLILEYPKQIENRDLRMHQRHITHLPAVIMLNDNIEDEDGAKIKGIIGDISLKGCGFIFKSDNPKIKVKTRDVTIQIQSSSDTQVKLQGSVCNSRYADGRVNVGIKFDEKDKQVKALLENLFIDAGLE